MDDLMTISAVIPAYNREKTIRRCIDSVLRQTHPVDEIIVVDDGSSDATLDILYSEYKDKVIIVRQDHKGAQAARNAGIKAARGEYIAFLDSDDEWMKKKTEIQVDILKQKPHAVVCGNGYEIIGNAHRTILELHGYSGNVYKAALNSSFALFPSIITRKDNLENIGMLDENVPSFQEWDTLIGLSKIYEVIFVDYPLFIYYKHEGETISKDADRDIAGQEYIFNKYKYEILEEYGIDGIKTRYRDIMNRCRLLKNKKYFKYRFLYKMSCKKILFL